MAASPRSISGPCSSAPASGRQGDTPPGRTQRRRSFGLFDGTRKAAKVLLLLAASAAVGCQFNVKGLEPLDASVFSDMQVHDALPGDRADPIDRTLQDLQQPPDMSQQEDSSQPAKDAGKDSGIVASPVLHFKFNEASGTAAADSSGSNNNGTVNGSANWVSGKINNALQLDGTSAYVDVPDSASLKSATTALTEAAWFNLDALPASGELMDILSKIASSNSGYSAGLYNNGGTMSVMCTVVTAENGFVQLLAPAGLSANTWYHAACSYDGAKIHAFFNGSEIGSVAQNGTILHTTNTLHVGDRNDTGESKLRGKIDDVRVYSVALSVGDVQYVYNGGSGTED
jgi:hypothetical protein